jgi:hypothetical protein
LNGNYQWLILFRFLNSYGLTVHISGSLNSATICTCISSYTLSTLLQVWQVLHFTTTYLSSQSFIINQQSPHSTLLPYSNLKSRFIQQNSYEFWIHMNFSRVQKILCAMLHSSIAQYHLYMAVSRENAFWLVQRNRDTSR